MNPYNIKIVTVLSTLVQNETFVAFFKINLYIKIKFLKCLST